MRYGVAVSYVLAWILLTRTGAGGTGPEARTATHARDLRFIFIAALFAHGAVPRLLFESFALIPTWLALLLFYLFPVMVTVGEHLLGRRRLGWRRLLTVALTLAGAALVANPAGGAAIHPLGVVLALAGAVCNAIFLLAIDPVLQRVAIHEAVALQFAGGTVAHLAMLAAGGAVAARLVTALPAWPWLLGLGLVTSGVAVTALNLGVQRIGAARTSIIGMLEPVFAVAWGVMLLGEPFAGLQGLGALLVVVGVTGSIRGD